MHRSSSTSRASDEFLVNMLPASVTMGSPTLKTVASDDLPIYDHPISDATKKEMAMHHKSMGENAIHLIPLVLILCAFILWLFSHPEVVRNIYCFGGVIIIFVN
ncbi:Transmembrane protein [Melia azedarach]|uniref:Transmembrane protein n=1 Tax=Melia azedarach TaxID=155640 RepID=A0ACC1XAL3_MELAZ|nr:Transmembrane protein [Melia azedarach]